MKTKITDTRRATRVTTVARSDYVDGSTPGWPLQDVERDTDAKHVDTRKLFVYFEKGEAADWTKTRTVYGSGYSTKTRQVSEQWRPAWVVISWSRRSDQGDVWTTESAKLRSHNVKKNGDLGQKENDIYMWTHSDYMKYLPSDVVAFIEEHAPSEFPFAIKEREDADV